VFLNLEKYKFFFAKNMSFCSTYHVTLSKYVKIFENFSFIYRDIAILSEICTHWQSEVSVYFLCQFIMSSQVKEYFEKVINNNRLLTKKCLNKWKFFK